MIFISGGVRSGKSVYAEQLALSKSKEKPVYIATSKIWDEDYKNRIDLHKLRRKDKWTTIEEPMDVAKHVQNDENAVYLIDCVSLWLTNIFEANHFDKNATLNAMEHQIQKLSQSSATIVLVSSEIGMGLHAENKMGRDFVDVLGAVNQRFSSLSKQAFFIVSGRAIELTKQ